MAEALPMSDFQRRVLAIPECYDVFLGGGRGGAKSHTFALIALRRSNTKTVLGFCTSGKATKDWPTSRPCVGTCSG
jgi:hypothetical protein